ncbi:MAG: hypothetical protein ABIE68_00345 [bacterium]
MPKNNLQSGFSTVIVLLILGIIGTVLIGSFAITTVVNVKIVNNNKLAHRAYQVAEAGAERILAEWTVDPNPVSGEIYTNEPFVVNGETLGDYTVSINDDGNGQWTITSKGEFSFAVRAVEIVTLVGLGGPNAAFERAVFVDSNLDFSVASGTQIWGDLYANGTVTWTNGEVQATDGQGTHFGYNPTAEEAPYGLLKYYYDDPVDGWHQIEAPTATNAGDAHGYWTSSQGIARNNVWLNTTHNIGDNNNPVHPDSDQYYNRDGVGSETLNTSSDQLYGEYTGIAIKDIGSPEPFPVVGNGSYANFASFYNSHAPVSTERDNLTILEAGSLTPLNLANGNNNAIIGATANPSGFPTQFVWNGSAIRDDLSTYVGPLIFEDDFILYVDGDIEINDSMGGESLTIIASDDSIIDTDDVPTTSFNFIVFDTVDISTNTTLNGIYYAADTINMTSNPEIWGSIITRNFNYTGGNTQITYVEDHVLYVAKWLPESATPTVNLISWKEIEP